MDYYTEQEYVRPEEENQRLNELLNEYLKMWEDDENV